MMKLFRYIGEFFLFSWLFGKLQHTENSDWDSQSYDDFHEEQDDYDMMDDF